ncbi:hypothetical protein GCM10025865_22850 [Paraoerskovia sediminicola]|uniref:Uncharacterized protein n=1 Tax=Paraoerskovia sediminicola TaxID=1138587 RepID=A0ABM8G4L9_9CELL|nr:hypothetical protein [Paraoerskovia sediminicola]BDZ42986.1 hypothetical protein GCM10025865_22850 [Paraoerskovia sediminicola]
MKGMLVLQRIIGIVLIVLGIAGIGLAVASATVWKETDTVVASTSASTVDGTTMVVTDPGVLELVDDAVTISATRADGGPVSLVVGRDVDVLGWVGEDPYTRVTGLSDWETLATEAGSAADATDDATAEPTDGATEEASADPSESPEATEESEPAESPETDEATDEATDAADTEAADADEPLVGPDPAGSDMWYAESSEDGSTSMRWTARDGRWSLLAAGTGDDASAPVVELTWPRTVTTPWLWPGVIAGALLLLIGAALLVSSSVRSARKRRTAREQEEAAAAVPVAAATGGGPAPTERDSAGPTATTVVLTRRELRERAAAEEAARAAEAASGRRRGPIRGWLTGQIPVVAPADDAQSGDKEPDGSGAGGGTADTPAGAGDGAAGTSASAAGGGSPARTSAASGAAWRKAWASPASGDTAPDGTDESGPADADRDTSEGPDAENGADDEGKEQR